MVGYLASGSRRSAVGVLVGLLIVSSASVGLADYPDSRAWFDGKAYGVRVALQNDLFYAGEYFGPIDGLYGPETYGAIRAFQQRAGLPATGVLTSIGRNRLRDEATRIRRVVAAVVRRSAGADRAFSRQARSALPSYEAPAYRPPAIAARPLVLP